MSGRNHRKRQGQRRKRNVPKRPKLVFLCDNNMTARLIEEINSISGYRTVSLKDLGLSDISDLGVKDKANRLNAPILTFDHDFTDPVNFKICTHPGVLWIHMSSQRPVHVVPRLRQFLQSSLYIKCKHAIVDLRDDVIIVTSRKGQEAEISYLVSK